MNIQPKSRRSDDKFIELTNRTTSMLLQSNQNTSNLVYGNSDSILMDKSNPDEQNEDQNDNNSSQNNSKDDKRSSEQGEMEGLNITEEYENMKNEGPNEDNYSDYLSDEELFQISPSDYGVLYLGQEVNSNEGRYFEYENNFTVMNNKNKQQARKVSYPIATYVYLVKGNLKSKDLKLVNPSKVQANAVADLLKSAPTMRRRNTIMSLKSDNRSIKDLIGYFPQTENSFLANKLDSVSLLSPEEKDKYFISVKQYKKKKNIYEYIIVKNLLEKFESFTKDKTQTQKIEFTEPFENLKKRCAKHASLLVNEIDSNPFENEPMKIIAYHKLRTESLKLLDNFAKQRKEKMDEKEKEIEFDGVADDDVEYMHKSDLNDFQMRGKFTNSWTIKFSELLNLWELEESTGIPNRLDKNYLIIRHFLVRRAQCKKEGKDLVHFKGGKDDLLKNLKNIGGMFKGIIMDDSIKHEPKMIFKETDFSRILMDLLVCIVVAYVIITVPVRYFLGGENSSLSQVAKFVDIVFYMDLICNFRNSFKNKSNDRVFKIESIMMRYLKTSFFLDFVTCIPWNFFVQNNASDSLTIAIVFNIAKIYRITRLLPLMSRLEAIGLTTSIRLIKLTMIFFLFAHWMACILIYVSESSILWNIWVTSCYTTNLTQYYKKRTLSSVCKYIIGFYDSSYIIPGQYTTNMTQAQQLASTAEYLIFIAEFLIGNVINAYIFGNITSILQNLNQGEKLFIEKTDLLREHMVFYGIDANVQNDISTYYEYIWQRHKDMIYGKAHFNLLSKSLRERFEVLNLLGHEFYMLKFHKLGNPKLVEQILINLRKVILFPQEILFEELSVTKGIYIVLNGKIILSSQIVGNTSEMHFECKYAEIISQIEKGKKNGVQGKFDENQNLTFPLIPAFIKTGRNWQRCFATDFADFLFLPLANFDDIIKGFPVEMHSLRYSMMKFVDDKKLFDNFNLFRLISQHSARSIGKLYQPTYDKFTIWIPIPIPISQMKISRNYVNSYASKVKNQWREILITGDLNIGINASKIINSFEKNSNDKKKRNTAQAVEQTQEISNFHSKNDLEKLKVLTKKIEDMLSTL